MLSIALEREQQIAEIEDAERHARREEVR